MTKPNNFKQCRRYNKPGDAHAMTFSCFHGLKLLNYDRTRRWFLDAIELARHKHTFDLWAYVVMPEHAHLLVWPRGQVYSISDVLSTIKQSVSKRAIAYLRKNAPQTLVKLRDEAPGGRVIYRFWQRGGGHDRNIYSRRDALRNRLHTRQSRSARPLRTACRLALVQRSRT
jgi:putative transposase